jgi:hypothetical protein
MDNGFVIDTPEGIEAFRLLALRGALRIEVRTGMIRSNRGRATSVIVREVLGSKTRDKAKLLAEFEAALREAGILRAE